MLPVQLYYVTKRARVWCQATGKKWQLASQEKKNKEQSICVWEIGQPHRKASERIGTAIYHRMLITHKVRVLPVSLAPENI